MCRRKNIILSSTYRRSLEAKATQLLRRKGLTWAGTPAEEVRVGQVVFERRIILTVPPGAGNKR